MKVVCLIDSLGSGGAQRQLCTLAVLLKRQGLDISMLTYHPHDFFLPVLQKADIPYTCLATHSIPRRIAAVRNVLRRGDQDVVLAFLEGPSLYAELAGIPRRTWGLVVSERLAIPGSHRGRYQWLRRLHRLADYVTANSHTNRLMIERSSKSIRSRVVTIYNTVDLETFCYAPPPSNGDRSLRIAVAASYQAKKNPARFVQAVALARNKLPDIQVHLDWYGGFNRKPDGSIDHDVYNAAVRCIEQHGLRDYVRLHKPSRSIGDVYRAADAVALPSFFEGLPNTICEAMATGRPILMSNVCDAGNLVKNGENGFLFDPSSPEDMAQAIVDLAVKSTAEREQLGMQSRRMAEQIFHPTTVTQRYRDVLTAAAGRKRMNIEHWTPDVPDSAYRSLG